MTLSAICLYIWSRFCKDAAHRNEGIEKIWPGLAGIPSILASFIAYCEIVTVESISTYSIPGWSLRYSAHFFASPDVSN